MPAKKSIGFPQPNSEVRPNASFGMKGLLRASSLVGVHPVCGLDSARGRIRAAYTALVLAAGAIVGIYRATSETWH